MATIVSSAKDGDVVLALSKAVMPEIVQIVPDAGSHAANEVTLLADALYDVVQARGENSPSYSTNGMRPIGWPRATLRRRMPTPSG